MSHVDLITAGDVNAGRWTMQKRLMFELGGLHERKLENLKNEAHELGYSFLFEFLIERAKDKERERHITTPCRTCQFFTPKYDYQITNVCRGFMKEMISAATQADCALLMIDANKFGLETSIATGNHEKELVA